MRIPVENTIIDTQRRLGFADMKPNGHYVLSIEEVPIDQHPLYLKLRKPLAKIWFMHRMRRDGITFFLRQKLVEIP